MKSFEIEEFSAYSDLVDAISSLPSFMLDPKLIEDIETFKENNEFLLSSLSDKAEKADLDDIFEENEATLSKILDKEEVLDLEDINKIMDSYEVYSSMGLEDITNEQNVVLKEILENYLEENDDISGIDLSRIKATLDLLEAVNDYNFEELSDDTRSVLEELDKRPKPSTDDVVDEKE